MAVMCERERERERDKSDTLVGRTAIRVNVRLGGCENVWASSSWSSVGSLLTISLSDRQFSLFGPCFWVTLEFAVELLARRVSVPVCHTAKPVDTQDDQRFRCDAAFPPRWRRARLFRSRTREIEF